MYGVQIMGTAVRRERRLKLKSRYRPAYANRLRPVGNRPPVWHASSDAPVQALSSMGKYGGIKPYTRESPSQVWHTENQRLGLHQLSVITMVSISEKRKCVFRPCESKDGQYSVQIPYCLTLARMMRCF
jgi:hypothetical protein